VALLADPAASQDVEILNFSKPPEAPPASAQLPAEAAGLKPQTPPDPAAQAAAAQKQAQANAQPSAQTSAMAKPKPVQPPPGQTAPAEPATSEVVDR